eukprot:6177191-Pleurochrysis_carterae.AAC.2
MGGRRSDGGTGNDHLHNEGVTGGKRRGTWRADRKIRNGILWHHGTGKDPKGPGAGRPSEPGKVKINTSKYTKGNAALGTGD